MNTPIARRRAANARLAVLIAAVAVSAAGCGGADAGRDAASKAPEEALLSSRDLAGVVRTDLAAGVPVQGTLEPAISVNIVAPYPELIEAVLVKEGQAVRRGQVLARFRASSMAPAAASAEAQRRVAAAEYERMRNLFREGAVAQRDVDRAEAELRAAEAGEAAAKKALDDAIVAASDDGVIATRFVQAGDRVGDGDPLFRLVNTSELEFAASVPTSALERIRVGDPVSLSVSGLDDGNVTGRIARINAAVDPATRQVKVYVNVANRDRRLAGDMFASGRILLDTVKGAAAVPVTALRQATDGSEFVWVVAAGKLEKRAVTGGLRDEARDLAEVKAGLREGERVVVSPIEGLVPGQPVRVAGDSAAADTTAAGVGAPTPGTGSKTPAGAGR